jgi:hypothetical protein
MITTRLMFMCNTESSRPSWKSHPVGCYPGNFHRESGGSWSSGCEFGVAKSEERGSSLVNTELRLEFDPWNSQQP